METLILNLQNSPPLGKLLQLQMHPDWELWGLFYALYHQWFKYLNGTQRTVAQTLFTHKKTFVVNVLQQWNRIKSKDYFIPSESRKVQVWYEQIKTSIIDAYTTDLIALEGQVSSLASVQKGSWYWSSLLLHVLRDAADPLRTMAQNGKDIEDDRLIGKLQDLQRSNVLISEIESFARRDMLRSLRYDFYGGEQLFTHDDAVSASGLKLVFDTEVHSENVRILSLLQRKQELQEERNRQAKHLQWMRAYLQKKVAAFRAFADHIESFPVFQQTSMYSQQQAAISIGSVALHEAIPNDEVLYFLDHILIFLLGKCSDLIAEDIQQYHDAITALKRIGQNERTFQAGDVQPWIAEVRQSVVESIRLVASDPLHAAALIDIGTTIEEFLADHWARLKGTKIFQPILSLPLPFHIPHSSRERHCYILGKSGSGKTELLKQFIHADIQAGHGLLVLDPHGDLAQECFRFKVLHAAHNRNRLVYISPEFLQNGLLPHYNPFDYTPLQASKEIQRNQLSVRAIELASAFRTILGTEFTANMELLMLNSIRLLLEAPKVHLNDFVKMLYPEGPGSTPYTQILDNHWDEDLKNYFTYVFPQQRLAVAKIAIITRFSRALSNQFIKRMFCAPSSSFDLRQMLDEGSIVIVNAKQSQLSRDGTKILGALLTAELSIMAMSRADRPKKDRKPVFAYIDECQTFLNETIDTLLAEARKYGVHLTMANQFLGQFEGLGRLKQSILANTAVKFCGSASVQDKLVMEKELNCNMGENQDLGKGRFMCRVEPHSGVVIQAYDHFLPPLEHNSNYASESETQALIQEQLKKYYRPFDHKAPDTPPISKNDNDQNDQPLDLNFGDL